MRMRVAAASSGILPFSFAVGVMFCGLATPAEHTDLGSKIYKDASPSVFLLLVKSSGGEFVAQGSGFLISGGRIVTNWHVAREGTVFLAAGALRIPLKTERTDELNDLAILTTSAELSASPLQLATSEPPPGESVFAIGNPQGLEKTISTGVVSGVREFESRKLLQITNPISPGSSGGPILNDKGEVIGVAVGSLKDGQNLNFAVPVSAVEALLRGGASRPNDAAAILKEAEDLQARQIRVTYSTDPESEYQNLNERIEQLWHEAFNTGRNNQQILLQIADAADSIDADLSVEAAERAVRLKASPKANFVLACALNDRAASSREAASAKIDRSHAETAARAALRGPTHAPLRTYDLLAEILEGEDKIPESESEFRRGLDAARAADDKFAAAANLRGLIRTTDALGKINKEKAWFDVLIASGEVNGWDWELQGNILFKLRDYLHAAEDYRTAATMKYFSLENWCQAATAYSQAPHQEDNALSAARECVKEATGKPNSFSYLLSAHLIISDTLHDRGVFDGALSQASEALAIDPSSAFAYFSEADALDGLHRYQEAINAAKEAIRLSDGKFGYMHFELGSAYFGAENWQLAEASFEKAAELTPTDGNAAFNVAVCDARLGYRLEAARWYEEALRRNPARPDREDVLRRIRLLRQ